MNYQTIGNLLFRPLSKKFFHSIHIDLRATSSEETAVFHVGTTRLLLMFRKTSKIQFKP